MPRRTERIVACPKCGEERATRAQRGVKLACLGCGEMYRCPAEEPDGSAAAAGDGSAEVLGDGSTDVEGDGSPRARDDGSARAAADGFVEATPKVRQQARPRGRGGDASPPAESEPSPPVDEDEDWQEKLGPRASRSSIRPKGQSRAKRAGAKGGSRRPGVYPGIVP